MNSADVTALLSWLTTTLLLQSIGNLEKPSPQNLFLILLSKNGAANFEVDRERHVKTSHEAGVLEHCTQTKMSVKYGKCCLTTPDIQYAVFQLL